MVAIPGDSFYMSKIPEVRVGEWPSGLRYSIQKVSGFNPTSCFARLRDPILLRRSPGPLG